MLRTRVRRAAARIIVTRPADRAFVRVPPATPLVARAAFRTGRDEVLERALRQLRRRQPAAAQVLLADLRTFQGRYGEAWQAAESADPVGGSEAAAARVVKLGYRVHDRAEADEAAVAAVARFPLSTQVMWQAALACAGAEQHSRIAEAWRSAAPDPYGLLRVVRQLATSAARGGEPDTARGWYREAITLLRDAPAPPRPATTRLAGLGAAHAIRDLCRALDSAGVPFFFAAGTALGLVRQGRPLGADNDLDVGIFDDDWDRDALIEVFTADPRFDLDLHPQTRKVGLRHRGGAPVDIFPFYEQDGSVWHDGVFVRWHNSPFTVARQRIGGVDLPLPADPERYLTENYGDWRTPFPGFDAFTDDAPNLEVTRPEYQRLHFVRRAYERLTAGDRAAARQELQRASDDELSTQL